MSVVRAIILRNVKYSEGDLIVQAFLLDGGKKSFLARGALKSRKRFGGGVLEATHIVDLITSESQKDKNLATLQEARLIESFEGLRTSYDKLDLSLRILADVNKVGQEGDVHSADLFNLLGHTFKALETSQHPLLVEVAFNLKFLHQQGILDFREWMRVYLQAPIRDVVQYFETEAKPEEWSTHLHEARVQLREYVQSAEGRG